MGKKTRKITSIILNDHKIFLHFMREKDENKRKERIKENKYRTLKLFVPFIFKRFNSSYYSTSLTFSFSSFNIQ